MGSWWPVSVKAGDWKMHRINDNVPSWQFRTTVQHIVVLLAATQRDQPSFHEASTKAKVFAIKKQHRHGIDKFGQ